MLTKSSPKHDKADQSRKMTGWGRDPAFGLAAVNSAVEVMAGSGIFKIEPRLQLDGAVQAQAQKQEQTACFRQTACKHPVCVQELKPLHSSGRHGAPSSLRATARRTAASNDIARTSKQECKQASTALPDKQATT